MPLKATPLKSEAVKPETEKVETVKAETKEVVRKEEAIQYFGTPFKASFRLNLIPNDAAFSLNIDSQVPIDCLIL